MKLLYPFSGVAGIFFPVGKPEDDGTCEFASKKCLLACNAIRCNNFNEIVGHEKKKIAYDFITKERVFKVCNQILEELEEMNCKILYWFASGDCMKKDIGKISKIINHLSNEGIIQLGFTRNKEFWEIFQKRTSIKILLTLESYKEIQKTQEEGLFAIPDYKTGMVKIYNGKYYDGSCGTSMFVYRNIEMEANCFRCYNKEQGCFA